MTLLLQIDEECVCSVPPQWTDVVAPDPEIVIGEQRALFRVVDLLGLLGLVDRLCKRGNAGELKISCKGNCAASVNVNMPQSKEY